MMSEPQKEPAKLEQPSAKDIALTADGKQPAIWCSWRPTTTTDKQRLLNALHGKVDNLADMLGEPIAVEHVLTQAIDLTNEETGEIVPSIRIVLISPTGEMYQCVSEYAWKALQSIASPYLYGPPPWTNGLKLRCVQHTSGRKRKYYNLEVVE
jgi:hypothetical protein